MPAEELERLQDERPGVVEEVFQAEETAEVRRALQTLTEQEQTVVRLIFYEDLSLRGAAKRLGWSPSQVQRRKESSQRKLGKLISRE
jgi:RNA polymerase sigma factor (sigma-70 family)